MQVAVAATATTNSTTTTNDNDNKNNAATVCGAVIMELSLQEFTLFM